MILIRPSCLIEQFRIGSSSESDLEKCFFFYNTGLSGSFRKAWQQEETNLRNLSLHLASGQQFCHERQRPVIFLIIPFSGLSSKLM